MSITFAAAFSLPGSVSPWQSSISGSAAAVFQPSGSAPSRNLTSGVSSTVFDGHFVLTRNQSGDTCSLYQVMADLPLFAGEDLVLYFSSAALSNSFSGSGFAVLTTTVETGPLGSPTVLAASGLSPQVVPPPLTVSTWNHHTISLPPLTSNVSDGRLVFKFTGEVGDFHIDEVRLVRSAGGSAPAAITKLGPSPVVAAKLSQMGVSALRYPGGALADHFVWEDSIGPVGSRGEVWTGSTYATPSFGLVEFLHLCVTVLGADPEVQVNVLQPPSSAANLFDFLNTASASTTNGALRSAFGFSQPANVLLFLFGSAPSRVYSAGNDQPTVYATRAGLCASSLMERSGNSTSLLFGFAGEVNHVLTTQNFEPGHPKSDPFWNYEYNWNTDVWQDNSSGVNTFIDGYGVSGRTFLMGHYHCPEGNEPFNFWALYPNCYFWASGACGLQASATMDVLRSTYTNIRPGIRMIASEYSARWTYNNDMSGSAPDKDRDVKAGNVVSNQLFQFLKEGIPVANLQDAYSDAVYGLMKLPPASTTFGDYVLRPAGLILEMFSQLKGATIIPSTVTAYANNFGQPIPRVGNTGCYYDIGQLKYPELIGSNSIPVGDIFIASDLNQSTLYLVAINRNYNSDDFVFDNYFYGLPSVWLTRWIKIEETVYYDPDLDANNEGNVQNVSLQYYTAVQAPAINEPFRISFNCSLRSTLVVKVTFTTPPSPPSSPPPPPTTTGLGGISSTSAGGTSSSATTVPTTTTATAPGGEVSAAESMYQVPLWLVGASVAHFAHGSWA